MVEEVHEGGKATRCFAQRNRVVNQSFPLPKRKSIHGDTTAGGNIRFDECVLCFQESLGYHHGLHHNVIFSR